MNQYPNAFNSMLAGPLLFLVLLVVLAAIVVGILPYWFIFKKAGFSPWLCILMLVPLANLIVLYVVAFSPWNVMPENAGFRVPPPPSTGYLPQA
jgi:hypothetical protein